MSSTSVSVIIPAFNAERYLTEAIESILSQSRKASEILLVDDGSSDRTPEIARSFSGDGLRYHRQDNAGLPAALNAGLELVSGEIVTFLDADDVWTKHKLELQLNHLVSDPTVEIVLGHLRRMWRRPGAADWSFTDPELALSLESCVFRRSVFDKVGLFDTVIKRSSDWDWFFRARELGTKILTHPEVVCFYRRSESNMSNEIEQGKSATVQLIKRSLERRRALAGKAESLASVTLGRSPGQEPREPS